MAYKHNPSICKTPYNGGISSPLRGTQLHQQLFLYLDDNTAPDSESNAPDSESNNEWQCRELLTPVPVLFQSRNTLIRNMPTDDYRADDNTEQTNRRMSFLWLGEPAIHQNYKI